MSAADDNATIVAIERVIAETHPQLSGEEIVGRAQEIAATKAYRLIGGQLTAVSQEAVLHVLEVDRSFVNRMADRLRQGDSESNDAFVIRQMRALGLSDAEICNL